MKCSKCGSEIKVGSVFCDKCGEAAQIVPDYNILEDELLVSILEEKKQNKIEDIEHNRAETKNNSSTDRAFDAPKKNTPSISNKKKMCIAGICAALLVMIISIVFVINSYSHLIAKGKKLDNKEAYAEALVYYEKAIQKDDSNYLGYYLAGNDYYLLSDFETAESYLLQSITLEPKNVLAYKALMQMYLELGDYKALDDLQANVTDTSILALFEENLVNPPVFSDKGGNFDDDITLTLTSNDGYPIYYSTDGSDPTKSGNGIKYNQPIEIVEGDRTIKAACQNEDGTFSQVLENTYHIKYEKPEFPSVSPMDGDFTSPTSIHVMVPDGCQVYYTWDGSTPTEASSLCTGTIDVPEGNNILSLIVVDKHGLKSDVMQCNYKYIPE